MDQRLSKVLFTYAVPEKKKTANYFIMNLITIISVFIGRKRDLLPLSTYCLRATYWPCQRIRDNMLHLKGLGRNPIILGDLTLSSLSSENTNFC